MPGIWKVYSYLYQWYEKIQGRRDPGEVIKRVEKRDLSHNMHAFFVLFSVIRKTRFLALFVIIIAFLKYFWLWPCWSPVSLNVCLSLFLCLSLRQNSSFLTLELNNSVPNHRIQLKFGTLRMYMMILMSKQMSSAVISCQQLLTAVTITENQC